MDRSRFTLPRIATLTLVLALTGCHMTTSDTRPPSDHFDGKRFYNVPRGIENGAWDVMKWLASRQMGPWDAPGTEHEPGEAPPESVGDGEVRVTFVNHSTVLIQTGGVNILTDPIYAERASPVPWAGPRRARPPGIRFEDLPRIDVVLLSHNPYDHLCLETLRRLHERDRPVIYTGLGNGTLLAGHDLGPVTEMDWWQSDSTSHGLSITFVPAQHFSGRGLFDRYESLWGGFVIGAGRGRIFFAGDSGAGPHFAQIRERLGPPDLALIPIGAFRPRHIMQPVHLSPDEAVAAHLQVGARRSMAIHFGTFPLADDGQLEPGELLDLALQAERLDREAFRVPGFGEALRIPLNEIPSR